ncbi:MULTISPECIES: SinI family restriction endonuclease [Synechocystis]|uniref:SinI family restriction endonuclease n=1 Tax=Synechocystis salina LEGE 00031 TaxID=1828736 RepID=A0ABR9VNZ8_9SYNC|nr:MULTISPECIES: SinI family restriction endonuclease [Synechocystis]MBE9196360.1 SinI family restriction endonuclease [Synechocystis sp. LEGE 06083]MBE9241055.1 SinI family restriction endonuclease [Synechocystis salina LEGE 00041]MBE9253096.1 SinI family restriction endonuclease [Synechocystis salina LEGE 00031]
MPVNFDTIITTSSSEKDFLKVFEDVFSQQNQSFLEAHRTILTACYRNPGLSPSSKKVKGHDQESLVKVWLKKYNDGFNNRISQRVSNPPGTVADPIIDTIINTQLTRLTTEHLEQIKYAHRLSMSAENILGLLLEEFLAEQLSNYGWHCCWGETIRHVDFCNVDGSLLQVKNRSNTENAPSSSVRINQPIEKWHRVDSKTGSHRWSYFNDKYNTDRFSEENFVTFVQKVLIGNPGALAIEVNNPWKDLSDSLN